MLDEELAEEWVKENMDCVKTDNCLNHSCNYFSDEERSIGKSAFEAGYNKANEWHFVKDGDLPKGKGTVLIYWKAGDIKCASVVESSKVTEDTHIIAWKEIVLPELKE